MNNTKNYLLTIFLSMLFVLTSYSQDSRYVYSLTISKTVNDNGKRISNYIEIDSIGKVYKGGTFTGKTLSIQKFNKKITECILKEKFIKNGGNNQRVLIEVPTPKLNHQTVLISIRFLDDFYKETSLINKTNYSWSNVFDKNAQDIPLFNYLSKKETDLLKKLLWQ
jgi:hypothetical protein